MAFSGTSSTSLAQLLPNYYNRRFLHRSEKRIVTEEFGQVKPVPKNEGQNVYFHRFKNLVPKTTALTEGVVPSSDELSTVRVSAVLAEYGNFTKISTFISDTNIDPQVRSAVDIMSYNAADTRDRQVLAELGRLNTEQRTGGAAHISEMTNVSDYTVNAAEMRKAVRTLENNKALTFGDGYWRGIVDPYVKYDWTGDSDWVEASRYAGSMQLFNGEIGRWMGIRFAQSTETFRTDLSGNTDISSGIVLTTFIMGQEAYGLVPLGNSKTKVQIKKPNANSTDQPLDRFNTVGWQGTYTQVVLNQEFLVGLKSRATDAT